MSTCKIFRGAHWISTLDTRAGKPIGTQTPTLRARKLFEIKEKPECVKAYVSGLGAFVMYINGVRVGDELLSPAFTSYSETVLFCEYDVTELLQLGENLVCIEVGSGFYNQSTYDGWSFSHAAWRDFEKLIFSLVSDGQTVLVSDNTWKVTRSGPRTNTQIRLGESYDARLRDLWLDGDFDDSAWQDASLTRIPAGEMKKQELPPIRICEKIQPLTTKVYKNGVIYDFGRNISGNVRVKIKGKSGDILSVKYGERIMDGELDESIYLYGIRNFSSEPLQLGDRYILSGEGEESFQAEFVYYGFRYVCISTNAEVISVEANFIHTDIREKGGFNCSSERLNALVGGGVTAFLSNLHGFSEDCPHREKNGWTGDACISVNHAVYRYDMKEFYKKWLADIVDGQTKAGQLPAIAPTAIYGYTWGSGPAWDHALFYIPETYYLETGDDSLFDGIIEAGFKYFDYAEKYENADGLVKFGLGDWCSPLEIAECEMGNVLEGFSTEGRKRMPVASGMFSDSCYHYANLSIFARALLRRGNARAEEYMSHAETVLSGIRKTFLDGESVDNGTQSALALALYFNIVTGETAQRLAKRLAEKVEEGGYKMQCGILGTKAIFNVFSNNGLQDICLKMLSIDDYPSYGFWLKCGLATFPELWEIADGSRNHHMYSDIVNWIYRNIGGIQNTGVGYDSCNISPTIFGESCSAESFTETARGRISVKWSYKAGEFTAETEIPEGCLATLSVMGRRMPLPSGKTATTVKKESLT